VRYHHLSIVSLLVLGSLPGLASGFGLYEPGVQGQGNAGAFTARAEDATAVFYNPAGLAQLDVNELMFSSKTMWSRSYVSDAGQSVFDSETQTQFFPELFLNYRFGKLAVGFGTTVNHAYEVAWDDADFPGRFLATGSEYEARELMGSLAMKLSERFSVGVTLRQAQMDVGYSRTLPRPVPGDDSLHYEVDERFTTDGSGTGFSVGLQYYRGRRLSVGLTYFSPIEIDLSGNREYSLLTRVGDQRVIDAFEAGFGNAPITSSIELPERIAVGAASRLSIRTRLEIDLTRDSWSSIDTSVYETPDGERTVIARDWDDIYVLRVAGDFQQRKALLWRLALSSTLGKTIPDETVEPGFADYDRFVYSFGVSYTYRRKWILEAALSYIQNRDRLVEDSELVYDPDSPAYYLSTGQDTLYETQRHQINIGVRYRFSAEK